jgi:hypothetical protein
MKAAERFLEVKDVRKHYGAIKALTESACRSRLDKSSG